jgi:site-specific recombinase XerD
VIAFVLKSPKAKVQKPYDVLSEAERRRFLDAASQQGLREYTLVSLALGAGLCVSELVNIRLDDFSRDEAGGWWVRIRMGKGRKDRLVPVHSSVMDAVRSWVKADGRSLRRKSDRATYPFSTQQSPRMTTARAWQLVKGLARDAETGARFEPYQAQLPEGRLDAGSKLLDQPHLVHSRKLWSLGRGL